MTIAPHSQTTTTTEAFDDAATAVEKLPPGHVTLTVEPGHQGHIPPSHDPNRPDLSFPFETTDTQRGGFTDEYRITSKTGYITADLALRPVPSHYHTLPAVLADPEKAIRLKQVKLVTWYENDPEDPRNWSKAYKWCMYLLTVYVILLTPLFVRYHLRMRAVSGFYRVRDRYHCWRLWRGHEGI